MFLLTCSLPYFRYLTVYDVTKRDTFTKLGNWLNELETYTTRNDIVKMLVGNKIDMVSGHLVAFSCTRLHVFRFVVIWLPNLLRVEKITQHVCFCLQDDREVDRNEGLKFARKHSMLFIGEYLSPSWWDVRRFSWRAPCDAYQFNFTLREWKIENLIEFSKTFLFVTGETNS